MESKKMPKGYTILWLCFTAAYLVWMCFFLHWDTYPLSESGIYKPWVYPIWIVVSTGLMLAFIGYMRRFLYSPERKSDKWIAMVCLIVGLIYVTWYGFLKNPLDYTASMIGLDYPWEFKLWGIISTASVFINTMYMFRRFHYDRPAGILTCSIGCAVLFVTINVPSAGEDLILTSLRCMSHWTGALLFALGVCMATIILLSHLCKQKAAKYIVLNVLFCLIVVLMLVLLITIGKDGVIEGIPVWALYAVLFLMNFTPWFAPQKKTTA